MDDFCKSDKDARDQVISRSHLTPLFGDGWNDDFYGVEFGTDAIFETNFNKTNGNTTLGLAPSFQGIENESTSMFDNFPLSMPPEDIQPVPSEKIEPRHKAELSNAVCETKDKNDAGAKISLGPDYACYSDAPQSTYSFKIISTASGVNVLPTSQNIVKGAPQTAVSEPVNVDDVKKFSTLISNLFHAYICTAGDNSCSFSGCRVFKSVIYHINRCEMEVCGVERCRGIRSFLKHFCTCPKTTCPVCPKVLDAALAVYCNDTHRQSTNGCIAQSGSSSAIFALFHATVLAAAKPASGKAEKSLKIEKPVTNTLNYMATTTACLAESLSYSKGAKNNSTSAKDSLDLTKGITEKPYESKTLTETFTPILNKLLRSSEAVFFTQPVDPVKLGIPDYPEIIREPMDLGTILSKLQNFKYTSIWDVIYDVNLVFDNAFLYNKKNTRVHKAGVKLFQIFDIFSSQLMKSHSYCCNRRFVYSLQALYCNSKDFCVIPCNAYYYRLDEKIYFCSNCYENAGDTLACNREGVVDTEYAPKSQFTRVRNNETVYEPFVVCVVCRQKFHKVCTKHVDVIDGCFYYCDACFSLLKIPRPQNPFSSHNLPRTEVSNFIEERVNNFLRSEFKDCKYVNIRLICHVEKSVETKAGLVKRFGSAFSPSFPYRSKALFAFQELDDKEVCFFSMHAQEYGINSPEPNKRRVYLSYLDSVHYFQPRHLKTLLYHEILLAYFSHCKAKGFLYCHIWSCPPCEGDDYVFHCHSFEQKLPKPRRLLEWYNKLIEIGVEKKIILEYKDIYEYFQNCKNDLATSIPYFDGDYWSNSLEDIITEYEKDSQVLSDNSFNADRLVDRKKVKKKVGKHKHATPKRQPEESSLSHKLFSLMDKYREVFFVLKLNEESVPFLPDQNPLFTSDLMDGRSGFLTICRDNHWEFSSFRHAFYSSKAMMFVVHQQMFNFTEFTCDKCRAVLCKGFHCDTCRDDFDLCNICHVRFGHDHQMSAKTYISFEVPHIRDKPGAKIPIDSSITGFSRQYDSFLSVVDHCVACSTAGCTVTMCALIKRFMVHFEGCTASNRNSCRICRQMFQIYNYHASHCVRANCNIPFCFRLKKMLNHTRLAADAKTRSRIANMTFQLTPTPLIRQDPTEPERRGSRASSVSQIFNGKGTDSAPVNDPIFSRQIEPLPVCASIQDQLPQIPAFEDIVASPQVKHSIQSYDMFQRAQSRSGIMMRQPTQAELFPVVCDPNLSMPVRNIYYNIPQHLINQTLPDPLRNLNMLPQDMNRRSVELQLSGNVLSAPSAPMDGSVMRMPYMTRTIGQPSGPNAFQNPAMMPQNLPYGAVSPHNIKFQLSSQFPGGLGAIHNPNRMISPRNPRPNLTQQLPAVRFPINHDSGLAMDQNMSQFGFNPRMVQNYVVQPMQSGQEAMLDANGNLVFSNNAAILVNNQGLPMSQLNMLQLQQLLLAQQGQRNAAPIVTFKPNNLNTMVDMNAGCTATPSQFSGQPNLVLTRSNVHTPIQSNPPPNHYMSYIPPTMPLVNTRPNVSVYTPHDVHHPTSTSNIFGNTR